MDELEISKLKLQLELTKYKMIQERIILSLVFIIIGMPFVVFYSFIMEA